MSTTLNLELQEFDTSPAVAIAVDSVSFDELQTLNIGSQSSGAGAGKVTFNPFSITRKPDTLSPILFKQMCSGTAFKKVTLTVTRSSQAKPFFSFMMGLVAVKTLSFSANAAGDPIEIVTFEYGQAAYSVAGQAADGSVGIPVATAWDRVKNVSMDPSSVGK